jgi:hypothetical protein
MFLLQTRAQVRIQVFCPFTLSFSTKMQVLLTKNSEEARAFSFNAQKMGVQKNTPRAYIVSRDLTALQLMAQY